MNSGMEKLVIAIINIFQIYYGFDFSFCTFETVAFEDFWGCVELMCQFLNLVSILKVNFIQKLKCKYSNSYYLESKISMQIFF